MTTPSHKENQTVPESKICTLCGMDKPLSEYWQHRTGRHDRYPRCKTCMASKEQRARANKNSIAYYNRNRDRLLVENRVSDRKERQRFKDKAFAAYGGYICSCCGVTIKAFLGIDHIDGWPAGTTRAEKVFIRTRFYRWLWQKNYPPGFRVLCHNCNLGRSLNGGTCPHEELRVIPAARRRAGQYSATRGLANRTDPC